jgi:receptor protein-tyrosine kinase
MPDLIAPIAIKRIEATPQASPRDSTPPPRTQDQWTYRIARHMQPIPEKLDPRLVLLKAPVSPAADAFRALRHKLRHGGDPAVVTVTSARRNEGTTTCATNLALALAEDPGAKVLLLEANARAPTLATLFSLNPQLCVRGQLAEFAGTSGQWSVSGLAQTNLHINHIATPGGPLARASLAGALDLLRASYNYIVIDAAPALDYADALALGGLCDVFVVTARARKSSQRDLATLMERLEPMPVAGVVLTDVRKGAR